MDIQEFYVIGISVKTTNEKGQSGTDILKLWERFFQEGILDKIYNKLDSSIYSVYTDYQGDHTQPYTVIVGCKVKSIEVIPEGMRSVVIPKGDYEKFIAKGKSEIYPAWMKIWATDLDRKYASDFEVYKEESENADIEIFIGLN